MALVLLRGYGQDGPEKGGFMEETCRYLVILATLLVSSGAWASQTREVVLMGKVPLKSQATHEKQLHIVITQLIQSEKQSAGGELEKYPLYSFSRDGLSRLKIELWGENYLLGVCHAKNPKGEVHRQSLTVEMQCRGVENGNSVRLAKLNWKKLNKRATSLKFRSWLSGPNDVEVQVEYDGIRG